MSRVELNQPAPDFSLRDFRDVEWRLSFRAGKKHVVLVFNRGFM